MSLKDLQKKYGEVFTDASFLLEEETKAIPIIPSLNIPLRGGVLEGSICLISGKEGSGKTTTALTLAANAQRPENGGRKVFLSDIEHRAKKSTLQGIQGLNCDPSVFQVIRSTEEKILSAEDHLNILMDLIKNEKKAVFIIDSSSALCSQLEMDDEVRADFRSNTPKLIANFLRHIASPLTINKSIVIVLQRLIADTSGKGGPAYAEDGGNALRYAANYRLRIKYTDRWNVGSGENEKQIGQILHFAITKAPHGPIDKIDSYLRYGIGLDETFEYINTGIDLGFIEKGGSWFTLSFLENKQKLQGSEKVYNHMLENPKDFELLRSKVISSLT